MTTMDCSTVNNETLAHLVIVNQMTATTGCTHEQAKQLLMSTDYRLEVSFIIIINLNQEQNILGCNKLIFR